MLSIKGAALINLFLYILTLFKNIVIKIILTSVNRYYRDLLNKTQLKLTDFIIYDFSKGNLFC